MLREIGSVDRVPAFVKEVRGGTRWPHGFGHRVWTNGDPRTNILSPILRNVLEVTGTSAVAKVALELERIARDDPDFVSHGLFPNVDFYSGVIYDAMGIPGRLFPALLAIARTAGWMAQWAELVLDPEQKMTRPKQLYTGYGERTYVPLAEREDGGALETEVRGPL
jgi:citrate synthase